MSTNKELTVNRLPAITWNRLKLNEARVRFSEKLCNCNVLIETTDLDSVENITAKDPSEMTKPDFFHQTAIPVIPFSMMPTGMGDDVSELLFDNKIQGKKFTLQDSIFEPVYIRVTHSHTADAGILEIHAKKNADATFIIDFHSDENTEGFFCYQTKVIAEDNSNIKIVQIQRIGSDIVFLNDFGGHATTDANVELIQLILDGEKSYHGVRFRLDGNRANFNLDTGYRLKNKEFLDINYYVQHFSPDTTCDIQVNGVLRDTCEKVFRGTIELVRGAFDANGNEQETVLAIDDSVINRSIPVILCGEENVQGNHGATMGKIDEDLLFYLASRGIPKEQSLEMVAQARIEGVVNKIEDEKTKSKLLGYLRGYEDEE